MKTKNKKQIWFHHPSPAYTTELIYCYNTFLLLDLIAAFVKTFIKATREAQQAAPTAPALSPSGAAPTAP